MMSIENGCDYYYSCNSCAREDCLVNKQKKEIERLTEENGWLSKECNKTTKECIEFQKQVDELKFDKEILQKLIDKREKDIAKEIECQIRELFFIPFEGKTKKQKLQREGMEEGLKMVLKLVKGYTSVEAE